jgi:predicted Zn-dependent peptidase
MTSLAAVAVALIAAQAPSEPAQVPEPANPFADIETRHLSNGLKLWYKRLPGEIVSISVALPFGADQDPPGKEQLAHFTEHMLFSDQPGRSEEEIKREIEERGGVYNASVSADRSFYYVRIGKEHAGFALDWLYRIIAPHAMSETVVERQREPVALEVGARPRQLFDWLWALYINPPALRIPGFWAREFGMETLADRDYYPYASLYSITSDDLRQFYERYYVPSLMTLTVIGDLEQQSVSKGVTETFARLPQRPEPELSPPLSDPGRYRQTIAWAYRSDVYYDKRFKFYDLGGDQEVMLIFLSHLLNKRLNDRLRFGERKATYGLYVGIVKRERGAFLYINGGIKADEYEYARSVVESELEALRTGSLSESEFEMDRAAVSRQLRVANAAPEDLEGWVRRYFYDPRVHFDFPDLGSTFDDVTLRGVQSFVQENFPRDRQVLFVIHPHPLNQGVLVVLIIAIVWLTIHLAARRLTRPVDMTRIRYVARFRIPRLYFVIATLLAVVFLAVAGRLFVYGFELLSDRFLLRLDSFLLQWSAFGAMLALTVLLLLLLLAHIPRKLLLFDDRLLVKYLSYRSVAIPAGDVAELALLRFPQVWLSRRLWRCVPLTIGLLSPGIYLRRERGAAYYFNVRDKNELLRLLREIHSSASNNAETRSHFEDPLGPS